jgi:hypothetical protein
MINENTKKFLNYCYKGHYTRVAICRRTKLVSGFVTQHEVRGFPQTQKQETMNYPMHSPNIWTVIHTHFEDQWAGCGNNHQSQIRSDHIFTEGIYIYNKFYSDWINVDLKETCLASSEYDLKNENNPIKLKCENCLYKFQCKIIGPFISDYSFKKL